MCELGFYKGVEGLLGEGNYVPKMLILLREPNSTQKKNVSSDDEWWFWQNVNKKEEKSGKRYINIYSRLIGKLYGVNGEKDMLKRCAYMNLRPDGGGSQRTKEFYRVLGALEDLSLDEEYIQPISFEEIDWNLEDTARRVARNRMDIIENVIAQKVKYIVTTPDIYEAIKKNVHVREEGKYRWKRWGRDYSYCRIGETGETILLSFPHPSYTKIQYNNEYDDLKELDLQNIYVSYDK